MGRGARHRKGRVNHRLAGPGPIRLGVTRDQVLADRATLVTTTEDSGEAAVPAMVAVPLRLN